MLSFENSLDFEVMVVSVSPIGILKILEIAWNIKQVYDPSSPVTFTNKIM